MKKKILVIDDSSTVRHQVATALEEFEIVEADNGQQGAEVIENREDIALVLCDISMPVMTGLEMLERIQGKAANVDLPIIMLTTEGKMEMIKKAQALGAIGWIVKPFKPEQLVAAAKKLTA